MKCNRHIVLFSLVSLFVLLSPCFIGGTFFSYDSMAHFLRMKDTNEQLLHLDFPPLFDYYSNSWYGYSWNMFYPPLSTYIMWTIKALTLYNITDVTQFKASVGLIIIISFFSMYTSAIYVLKSKYYAQVASILFVTSGYFINDAFIRIDLGELLAMGLSPMIIVGSRALVTDSRGQYLFPIGVLGILLANIPSFIASMVYLVIYFCLNIKSLYSLKALKTVLKSIAFVSIGSLFFTVPLIYHFIKGEVFAFHALAVSYNTIGKFGINAVELFFGMKTQSGMTTKGLVISAGIILNILFLLHFAKNYKHEKMSDLSISLTCIILCLASTQYFPWYIVSEKTPILRFIQFPWRFMLIAVPAMVLISTRTLMKINIRRVDILIISSSILFSFYPMQNSIQNRVNEIAHHDFHDYMTTAFEKDKDLNIKYIQDLKKGKNISEITSQNSTLKFKINDHRSEIIALPLMYYPGYSATLNGVNINLYDSEKGIASIKGPAIGLIEITYNKIITTIPFIISIVFLLLCAFLAVYKNNKKPR